MMSCTAKCTCIYNVLYTNTHVAIILYMYMKMFPCSLQPSQVGSLFTFLARQGAKYRTSINVDETIYDQVLNYITHTDEDIVNEERQQVRRRM